MDKVEVRAVIKYFCKCKKGMSAKDIYDDFIQSLKVSPSYSTVVTWAADFRRGRENV